MVESTDIAKKMEQMKQPNVDNRVKTEDVMNTKGLTFKSFGLSEEVQFVSQSSHFLYVADLKFNQKFKFDPDAPFSTDFLTNLFAGYLRNGIRVPLPYPRRGDPGRA